MAGKRRAVSSEDKQARRDEILATGLALLAEQPFETINMNEVARRTGLAKGTLYLYFRSKEELFLALLQQELQGWLADLGAALAQQREFSATAFTRLVADSLQARPLLLRLAAILHIVLERNIDFDTALAFKRWLGQATTAAGALLETRLPFLRAGEGERLLIRVHALAIGLQHQAEPAPVIAQALEQPELALFRIDFKSEFLATLEAMLRGLAHREETQHD